MAAQSDSTFTAIEVFGSSDISVWNACFAPWRTALIMADAASPARLDGYSRRIASIMNGLEQSTEQSAGASSIKPMSE
jgi:hypothetical protein